MAQAAMIPITAPDGRVFNIAADDPKVAAKAVRKILAREGLTTPGIGKGKKAPSLTGDIGDVLGAFNDAAGNSLALGLPHLENAGIAAGVTALKNAVTRANGGTPGYGAGDAFAMSQQLAREKADEHPIASGAGGLFGGLGMGGLEAGAGKYLMRGATGPGKQFIESLGPRAQGLLEGLIGGEGKAATAARAIPYTATAGAISGGAGSARPEDIGANAAEGAQVGAALGAASPYAAAVIAPVASTLIKGGVGAARSVGRFANMLTGGRLQAPAKGALVALKQALRADGATSEDIRKVADDWLRQGGTAPATILTVLQRLENGGENTLKLLTGAAASGRGANVATKFVAKTARELQPGVQARTQELIGEDRRSVPAVQADIAGRIQGASQAPTVTPGAAGAAVHARVNSAYNAAKAKVDQAYQAARNTKGTAALAPELSDSLDQAVRELMNSRFDPDLQPKAWAMAQKLRRVTAPVRADIPEPPAGYDPQQWAELASKIPGYSNVEPAPLEPLWTMRTKLGMLQDDGGSEGVAASALKRVIDEHLNQAAESGQIIASNAPTQAPAAGAMASQVRNADTLHAAVKGAGAREVPTERDLQRRAVTDQMYNLDTATPFEGHPNDRHGFLLQNNPEYASLEQQYQGLRPTSNELLAAAQGKSRAIQQHLPDNWTVSRRIVNDQAGNPDRVVFEVRDPTGRHAFNYGADDSVVNEMYQTGRVRSPAEMARADTAAGGQTPPANDTTLDTLGQQIDEAGRRAPGTVSQFPSAAADPMASVNAWRDAIRQRAALGRQFEGNDIIARLVKRGRHGEGMANLVAPEDASTHIFGANGVSTKPDQLRDLTRLRDMIGADSPEWQALQQEGAARLLARHAGTEDYGQGLTDFTAQQPQLAETLVPPQAQDATRTAQAQIAQAQAQRQAIEAGQATTTAKPDEFAAALPDTENMDLSRLGAVRNIQGQVGTPPQGATKILNQIANPNGNIGENLTAQFGPEETTRYQQSIQNDLDTLNMARLLDVKLGSKTMRVADALADTKLPVIPKGIGPLAALAVRSVARGSALLPAEKEALVKLGTQPIPQIDLSQLDHSQPASDWLHQYADQLGQMVIREGANPGPEDERTIELNVNRSTNPDFLARRAAQGF